MLSPSIREPRTESIEDMLICGIQWEDNAIGFVYIECVLCIRNVEMLNPIFHVAAMQCKKG